MPSFDEGFSVAHAAALPGAEWLQKRRVEAAEAFRGTPLPTAGGGLRPSAGRTGHRASFLLAPQPPIR